MVHFFAVAKLMNHNTIQHLRRSEHQQAVEIEITLSAAATPLRPLVPYSDPAISDANLWGIVSHSFRYDLQSLICKSPDFIHAQRFDRIRFLLLLFNLVKVLFDPVLMLEYKHIDLGISGLQRGSDDKALCIHFKA